jgi:hypothetical protein
MQVALLGARVATLAGGGGGHAGHARCQGGEDRIEPLHHADLAADHQAIAALQSPNAPGGADVEVVDPPGLEFSGAADVVLPEGVAAVDQHIDGTEQARQFGNGGLGDLASRQHQPDDARGGQRSCKRGETVDGGGALTSQSATGLGVAVMDDAGVAMAHETARDVGAHATEPDDADVHASFPPR